MGTLIKALCDNCHYEKNTRIGADMMAFDEYFLFPSLNKAMKRIEERNIYKRDREGKNQSHIVFYDDDESLVIRESLGREVELESNEYHLSKGNYYCPECGKYTLRFHFNGIYE